MRETYPPVAVLYQSLAAPVINGVRKPMKKGGYADSGADIAYVLRAAGVPVVTPAKEPRVARDLDWVFPDDSAGIQAARAAGAALLWANTILFDGHPLERAAKGLRIVGQRPELVQVYDDKWVTNSRLRAAGLPVAASVLVALQADDEAWSLADLSAKQLESRGLFFPLVLKPVRGRGSQGVVKVDDLPALLFAAKMLLADRTEFEGASYSTFGQRLILEEYLAGDEITVTVLPPGRYHLPGGEALRADFWPLPPVGRFNHRDGIAPYAGVVAVIENSRLLTSDQQAQDTVREVMAACVGAARLIAATAPIRVDCRRSSGGGYRMFDVNMKPNMTGAGRPGRENQDSLTCLAARAMGWSYSDLLLNMMRQSWPAS